MKIDYENPQIPFQDHLPNLYLGTLIIALIYTLIPGMSYQSNVMVVFTLFIGFSYYLHKKNKIEQSIMMFLVSGVIVIGVQIWYGNGLNDPTFLAIFGIVLLSALLGNIKNFIALVLLSLCLTIFIGVAQLLNWSPSPQPILNIDIVALLAIIILSGIAVGWYSKDYKTIMSSIHEENQRLHESEEEIHHLAYHDALTGLLNTASCQADYKELVSNTNIEEKTFIFAFIDLDNFKPINDTYSHKTGDKLLIEVANRIQQVAEEGDLCCRLGGDEFLLISIKSHDFPTHRLAKDIFENITKPFKTNGVELEVSASVGIALAPQDGINFDDVRKKADIAMYKSKHKGKNIWSLYNDDLHEKTLRHASIISGMRKAIRTDSLDLYYQPKTDITTGETIGAEALLRWSRNNPYQIFPDEFIPVIESTDLIIEIGAWVVEEACMACKRWHEAGHDKLRVAINVSVMQLSRNNLKSIIEDALEKAGLEARFLEIELTEHLLLTNTDNIAKQLEEIKALGVTLAIDDFGTGYSNLSYLARFNVDTLKLDRSFISQVTNSEDNLAIVTAVIAMAKIININTIAEGIESADEWKILQDLGCDHGQGYLWGKPMPKQDFQSFLIHAA